MPFGLPDSFAATAALRGARRIKSSGGRGGSYVSGPVIFKITFSGLVLYKPILNYELNVPGGMVGRHMSILGAKIEAGAKKSVGKRTGRLAASIHTEHKTTGGRQYIKVGSNVPYALMHHEGTRPHMITANPPRTHLRFKGRGGVVYTTSVMHPGTKANRYLSSQLRKFIR